MKKYMPVKKIERADDDRCASAAAAAAAVQVNVRPETTS